MFDGKLTRTVSVQAVEINGKLILLDRHGNRLGKAVKPSSLGEMTDPFVLNRWRWKFGIDRMRSRITKRNEGRDCDPWQRRAESLAASLRLRKKFHRPAPTGRCQFEAYPTSTWEAAAKRMWHQANNRFRRHQRSGWASWAHTVANNHNKKRGGCYAKENPRYRKADHGDD